MLVAALLALTLSDSRYVKVEPGFVSEHGDMEMDKLIVSPDGEAVMTSTRHSIDSTSSGVKEFTGQFEAGTEITIVFTALLGHRGDITHSLAGPFVVESGDGVQEVVAKTAVRKPIVIRNQNAERGVAIEQSFLDLPLKRMNGQLLKNVIDRRQWANRMAVKAPADMWTVATEMRTRFDRETKEKALISVLEGCDYRLRLSAAGHETSVVSLSSTDDQLHVALKETPPLVLKVTDSSGRPMENVRIHYSRCPEEEFHIWAHHRLDGKAQNATDADGIARIAKLNGGAKYDIYLDAGRRGRSILQAVSAGTQNSVTLFADPPLTVNLKNLPADAAALPIEVVEEVPDGGGFRYLVHGPFKAEGTDVTVELPPILGETLTFHNAGKQVWEKTLHVNARGREATIDVGSPAGEFYVDPSLASPQRKIALHFRTPDGARVDDPLWNDGTIQLGTTKSWLVGQSWTFGERDSKHYAMSAVRSGTKPNTWETVVSSEKRIQFDFRRVWFPGYLISPNSKPVVEADEDDALVEVDLVPAAEYALDSADFADLGTLSFQYSTASTSLSFVDYDRRWVRRYLYDKSKRLYPSVLRVPANQMSLMAISAEDDMQVFVVDGQGGKLPVDWTTLKRTTIQALDMEGRPISTGVYGLLIPDSGITDLVDVDGKSEAVVVDRDDSSKSSASRFVMNFQSSHPVAALVGGREHQSEIVALTPGEDHEVRLRQGRTLWIDLLNEDGSDVQARISERLTLTRPDGFKVGVFGSEYRCRYVGLPERGQLTFRAAVGAYDGAEIDFDLDDREVIGLVFVPPEGDGAPTLRLTDAISTGQRSKNRERFLRSQEPN